MVWVWIRPWQRGIYTQCCLHSVCSMVCLHSAVSCRTLSESIATLCMFIWRAVQAGVKLGCARRAGSVAFALPTTQPQSEPAAEDTVFGGGPLPKT